MRKKRICVFLVLILLVVFLYFYLRPQPVNLEMSMCSRNGETIQFVLSGAWYRQLGGKRILMGDIWVDGVVYHSIKPGNWNWKDQEGKKLIPTFLGERQEQGGFPYNELELEFLSEGVYRLWILSLDQDLSTTYYGPATSKEECELLLQKYYNDY